MADLESLIREVEEEVLGIVRFCADEVERQRADPDAVCWMVEAWLMARRRFERTPPLALASSLTPEIFMDWGRRIEPIKNAQGFRDCDVRVGSRQCPPYQEVPKLMAEFVSALSELTPEEAYLRFQLIHGFRDGNGRTGKILFNWLRGSLNRPEVPPNFFDCSNP